MDKTRVKEELLFKGETFLTPKYLTKVLLRRQMCEIFDKPIHQWMIKLFANYLSVKPNDEFKKLGYRSILFIVDTIGSFGKMIISQFYQLELSNYLVMNYIPEAKASQEILRAVSTNKKFLSFLNFVRTVFGGPEQNVGYYTKIERKTQKMIRAKAKEPFEGNKIPYTLKE